METDQQYAERLKELDNEDDTEVAHIVADDLLCEILNALGFTETVKAFDAISKWYA